MRLLDVQTLEVGKDVPRGPPQPYVIASHRWVGDEATFQDVRKRKNTVKLGFQKIKGFAAFVEKNIPSVDRLWIDTCCIDKKNATELSTAINSMFQWYLESRICLAYLADVFHPEDETAFRESVWFRRGWTLQELLAPRTVVFLTKDWQVIGHKGHADGLLRCGSCLNSLIADITGIPEAVLQDYDESRTLSPHEKFKWMNGRDTTLGEDLAYCQIGIHDVSMPIWYGGDDFGKKAMARLQEEINKARTYIDVPSSETWSASDDLESTIISPEAIRLNQVSKFGYCANQLAGSAQRLVALSQSTAHMPRPVTQLATACERLSSLLRALQNLQQANSTDITLLMRCIHDSGRSEDDFQTLVRKINHTVPQLSERQASKDDALDSDIQDLVDEVCDVTRLLQFAMDIYFDQRRRTQLTFQGFEALSPASHMSLLCLEHRTADHSSAIKCGKYGKRKAVKQTFRTVMSWGWICSKVWDIALVRAQSGWDVQFRVYNEVAYDSPIFEACRDGDVHEVRRLVASGAASLQDRWRSMTLLWRAAYEGHYDMYKYLLSQMAAPARAEQMAHALSAYTAKERPMELDVATYRLFIESYDGLDVDLDDSAANHSGWWTYCPNNECRSIILNSMSLQWSERPISEQFQHAMDVYAESPHEILRLCGLNPCDRRLKSLRDKFGFTALHTVADRLALGVDRDLEMRSWPSIEEWVSFGIELLTIGLDPHYAPPGQETPLIRCLHEVFQRDEVRWPYTYHQLQRSLNLWMKLVQDAGLDAGSYVQRENALLMDTTVEKVENLDYPSGLPSRKLLRIECFDNPLRWSLVIREVTPVGVWTFDTTPGAFGSEPPPVPTICWRPSVIERDEGHWVLRKVLDIHHVDANTAERSEEASDPFESLIESSQDDTGVVALITGRGRGSSVGRARSSSAPQSVCRRGACFVTARLSKHHQWLKAYHVCPRDGRRRTGCELDSNFIVSGSYKRVLGDLRSCVNCSGQEETAAWKSDAWEYGSFLWDIYDCQRTPGLHLKRYGGRNEELAPLLRHNYGPDCPQGCGRVKLHKFYWTRYKNWRKPKRVQ